jgi:hypothetical protein
MRVAGAPSWRLEGKNSDLCELALFVRDATGLVASREQDDVPPLTGSVPNLAHALDANALVTAGGEWREWWRAILNVEFRDRPGDQGGSEIPEMWARQAITDRQAVCDPPDFDALADRPALRAAAHASVGNFKRWRSTQPVPGRDGAPHSPLDWSLMKQVAEDVAFDRRVSLDEVQARVAVLPVRDTWWRRAAPGAVLCSPAAAADPHTAHALLRDAFDSYVLR